ncbi:MAG: hypothetical protein IJY78_05315 [Bacteroidaceae bacterium]|nr:hypothetical protein [Bacteroidaceae bacterium]
MKNKNLAVMTMLFLLPLSMTGQTVIEGTVADSLGTLADAYVTVSPKGGTSIVGFADTDEKGHYRLEFTTEADSVTVIAAGMTIGRHMRTVANRSQKLDIRVAKKSVELKEVSVKAQKIRLEGDTLKYNVAAYTRQGDRVIGDVLKNMPGIEVSESGRIKFNGKSIKKFYVEDMDLLQGRYGIATNNINAQDVATVEVLENHQPVKSLQGKVLTDDVAINLKLKNSAKGTVAVNSMFGGGYNLPGGDIRFGGLKGALWTAELVGMHFAKTRQNMTLYKGNNTGDDVSKELTSHYSSINSVGLYPFCPTGAILPSGSGLPQKRTFDNRSHVLSANHLEKLGKDAEMTFNLSYHDDNIRREGNSQSDIFLSGDRRLHTSEAMVSQSHIHNLSGQARYCRNASDGFLANVLSIDANWNSDDVTSSTHWSSLRGGTGGESVSQRFDRPGWSVSNTFNTIRNIGKHNLDLHFSLGYSKRPNTLAVGIDSLAAASLTEYVQDVNSHHIAGDFHTNFRLALGDFKASYGIVAHASLHGIETDLSGYTSTLQHANDLWYNTYELTLGQHYTYDYRRFQVNLGCPLSLYTQMLDDRIRHSRDTYTHLLVSPTLSMKYYWRDWSSSMSASYNKTVGDPGGIYSGYIMHNYRSFQRSYVDQLSETDRIGANLSVSYRNALTATFANIGASCSRTRDNQIYGYDYDGATSVVNAVDRRTVSDSYSVSGELSKGFDWLQSSLRAFGGYSASESERLVGGKVYALSSRTVSIGGGGTITPLPWFNIVVSSGYSWSRSSADGASAQRAQTVRSATQRVKMNVYVTKNLTLAATAEDNYNNLTADNRHAWFGDVQAKYRLGIADLELEVNNVFNQKTYTRVNYSGLDIHSSTSMLRPMNIVAKVRFKLL